MNNNFTIKEVSDFWDKVSDIYESSNEEFKETHAQRFEEAIKHIENRPNQKILNIWSRTGMATPYLRKHCPEASIDNLEVSPEFIKISKQKFPNEIFQTTDLEKLDFKDNHFDCILSLETLEHTPSPLALVKELYRTMKQGGLLVLSCPPATAEIPLRIYESFFKNHGEGPHKFLASKKVKELLTSVGFKIQLHKGTLLIPVGPKFLKKIGEKIINKLQKTPISELGIRQFYICKK